MALEPITRQEKIIAGQDLTPITRMEMFLKEYRGGSGGGSGGVTSWNDLTDRPFYEESVVLLPETQFEYDEAMGAFFAPGYIEFVVGNTYTVKWNGVDYTAIAVPGEFNDEILVMLGNPAALGGTNNNLPFAVGYLAGSIGAIPLDGSTAVNVGISGYLVTKIPVKYVPSMRYDIIVKEVDASESVDANGGKHVKWSMSYDTSELYDAIIGGYPIYVQVQNDVGGVTRFQANGMDGSYLGAGSTVEEYIHAAAAIFGKDSIPLSIYFVYQDLGTNACGRINMNYTDDA